MREDLKYLAWAIISVGGCVGLALIWRSCDIASAERETECRKHVYDACIAADGSHACADDAALACNGSVFHASGTR